MNKYLKLVISVLMFLMIISVIGAAMMEAPPPKNVFEWVLAVSGCSLFSIASVVLPYAFYKAA